MPHSMPVEAVLRTGCVAETQSEGVLDRHDAPASRLLLVESTCLCLQTLQLALCDSTASLAMINLAGGQHMTSTTMLGRQPGQHTH